MGGYIFTKNNCLSNEKLFLYTNYSINENKH